MPGAWEVPQEQKNVLVAILTKEVVYTQWAVGFKKMLFPEGCTWTFVTGMPYDSARNEACHRAINNGFKWILFVDDDVIPPPDVIPRLCAHNVPIVSGLYTRRSKPVAPVMMRVINGRPEWVTNFVPGSIQEVDYAGAGCMMINCEILKKLPKPWFDWRCDSEKPVPERTSEDYTFCAMARRNGMKILVDTSVQCLHLGPAQSSMNGFEPIDQC